MDVALLHCSYSGGRWGGGLFATAVVRHQRPYPQRIPPPARVEPPKRHLPRGAPVPLLSNGGGGGGVILLFYVGLVDQPFRLFNTNPRNPIALGAKALFGDEPWSNSKIA